MKKIASGKVREIFELSNKELLIVTTDRISAFDSILKDQIPGKGKVLNNLSLFWFDFLKNTIPNHIITSQMPDELKEYQNRAVIVKKLSMLPVECVVRGYISGSAWQEYKKTGKVFGLEYPNLQESSKFDEPIFTPTTKAEVGHDEYISYNEVEKLIGIELAKMLKQKTIEIYKKCANYALTKGIIIADTKFEFGLDENNVLTLADEVLTPDSSRFWPANQYKVGHAQNSYDKQIVRNWLISKGAKNNSDIELPKEIIEKTANKYKQVFSILAK
jgi:phosphoribosylaminoimidazole-succinocarboxamide synthase